MGIGYDRNTPTHSTLNPITCTLNNLNPGAFCTARGDGMLVSE